MKHIHIDKAIGGTNDGATTPYIDNHQLNMIKKRDPEPVRWRIDCGETMQHARYEIERYRLERFHADDYLISFWVEHSMSPAAALCQMLLRYIPREDMAQV